MEVGCRSRIVAAEVGGESTARLLPSQRPTEGVGAAGPGRESVGGEGTGRTTKCLL